MKNLLRFSVHGKWGSWGAFGACTAACGGGVQTRYRNCNKPAPTYGGKTCPGEGRNIRGCNTHHCPGMKSKILHFSFSLKRLPRKIILSSLLEKLTQNKRILTIHKFFWLICKNSIQAKFI